MKTISFFACLFPVLLFAFGAFAGELPHRSLGNSSIHGGHVNFHKSGLDTINLMAATDDPTNTANDGPCHGVEPYYDGDFQEGWNGWTSIDITEPTVTHWEVSDYDGFNTPYSSLRAWCGDIGIVPCSPGDPVGGYGNSWHDLIQFTMPVGNPTVSTQVEVTAMLQHHTEPGYDFTYLSYRYHGEPFGNMGSWDDQSQDFMGNPAPIARSGSVTYLPPELVGGTNIDVYWRFKSDGGWSDEDCSFASAGACQLDDVNVKVTNDGNITNYFTDFNDGSFGYWNIGYPEGDGDFAEIYIGLEDAHPCTENYSRQVAFIDDGVVVPGTGGSDCINWCYGPGGYIVTTTGGLAGEDEHIHNAIESPVMDWPQAKDCGVAYDGITFGFTVYSHEDLSADSPGMFYTWGIRSADTDGSDGPVQVISEQPWRDRNAVYYGGPYYVSPDYDVTFLMNPGRDEVQVQLAVYEYGWVWYWTGNDGYPAPYFDDVTVKVFPYFGPSINTEAWHLAQDNFPERGTIDYGDLGSHSVRFDAAQNISLSSDLRNDPGDTITMNVAAVRAGSELVENPRLYYKLRANPAFTPAMRTAGLPDEGFVSGMPAVGYSGTVVPDKWAFDLPDTGFLFPGDVLHYFIGASDEAGGEIQSATLPADTSGFSNGFGNPMAYNPYFIVRALPSILADGFGGYEQPGLLFIKDAYAWDGWSEWFTALNNIGLLGGEDFDVYYVQAASASVGNGIGGRANDLMLMDYSDILYSCAHMGVTTISNGDYNNDPGNDVSTLTNWVDEGGKDIFLTGDNLASDLAQSGPFTLAFLEQKMGLRLVNSNIRPFIGNQSTPLVKVIPDNPVFLSSLSRWVAFGGCFRLNTFDALETYGGGQRIAEFNDPNGVGYSYSACTLNIVNPGPSQSRVISMPLDLMFVDTDHSAPGNPLPARAQLLRDVLEYFNIPWDSADISGTEDVPRQVFTTSNFPNPFNPTTTIKYSMPRAGHLLVSIFNVRGQLLKTLIDGQRPAGADQTIIWDGTDNLGSAVSSGLYFYEARTAGEVKVRKMTLVK